MNVDALAANAPMILYALVAFAVIYLCHRYKKKNDLRAWLEELRSKAIHAGKDEVFRRAELADAEAELTRHPAPDVIVPVGKRVELYLHLLPKILFFTLSAGAAMVFVALFQPAREGEGRLLLYLGAASLLLSGALFLVLEKLRAGYTRVRQLNRKYLMQKAGGDFDNMFSTFDTILEYYPAVPELRLEEADQLARAGRMEDAVEAIEKATRLKPGNLDLTVVQLSFVLRKGDTEAAESILAALPEMKPLPSDPRPSLYAAALALRQNDREKAAEHLKKSLELDKNFTEMLLPRDETLAEVKRLAEEKELA